MASSSSVSFSEETQPLLATSAGATSQTAAPISGPPIVPTPHPRGPILEPLRMATKRLWEAISPISPTDAAAEIDAALIASGGGAIPSPTIAPAAEPGALEAQPAPGTQSRRASIVEYLQFLVSKYSHPFTPTAAPADLTLRAQGDALRSLVNKIVADFAVAQIVVDRNAIMLTISRIFSSPAAFVTGLSILFGSGGSHESWAVTNATLAPLFGLIDTSAATYTFPEETTGFYFRTRSLAITDVQLMIEVFEKKYHHKLFTDKMRELVREAVRQGKGTIHLRYVGTCEAPSTPVTHITEDLTQAKTLFGKVEVCLQQIDVDGMAETVSTTNWTASEVVNARLTTEDLESVQDVYTERILISLLGYDNLINVQRGGFLASYEPSNEDRNTFQALGTQVGNVMLRLLTLSAEDMQNFLSLDIMNRVLPQTPQAQQVDQHFDNVFAFIRNNPETIANLDFRSRMNAVLQKSMRLQAIPKTEHVQGSTLFLLVGKDLPFEATTKAGDVRFFYGDSRAGTLGRNMLTNLLQWEGRSTQEIHHIFELLTFVDLCPWLILTCELEAADLLSSYLCLVTPWVTVTFSALVSRMLINGFQFYGNITGQPTTKRFLNLVGSIYVASFDNSWLDDPAVSAPPDGSYTLVIPHYHPGRNKYGEQHPLLRRVLLLTWIATFVLIEEASRILQDSSLAVPSTRQATCHFIKTRTDARLQSTGFTALLDAAKTELGQYLANHAAARAAKTPPLSVEARELQRSRRALRRALRHANFIAEGDPKSPEREEQLKDLYSRRRPELGMFIPYSERQQWFDWMATRSRGTSYIIAIVAAVSGTAAAGPQGIFHRSLGLAPGATGQAIEQAIQERLQALQRGCAAFGVFQRAQQSRVLLRHGRDPVAVLAAASSDLEGQEVTLHSKAISFYGTIPGNNGEEPRIVRVLIHVGSTILRRNPRLSFRPAGLRLIAEDGEDFGIVVSTIRMPLLQGYGQQLLTVWRAQRERILNRPLLPAEIPQLPGASSGDPKLPTWSPRATHYRVKPINELSALWLFQQWFDSTFTDSSNEIRFHWNDATLPFTAQYPAWITENFPLHPWAAWWQSFVTHHNHNTRSKTNIIRGCITALRGPVITAGQYAVGVQMGKVWRFGHVRTDEELE
ncbi:hypothetical protein DFJ77DRAFT_442906 [Powellomyces hirtus]|nr:hypothetical protein DFJ77DRAFT_442906 [Powellomyces hirtus]